MAERINLGSSRLDIPSGLPVAVPLDARRLQQQLESERRQVVPTSRGRFASTQPARTPTINVNANEELQASIPPRISIHASMSRAAFY